MYTALNPLWKEAWYKWCVYPVYLNIYSRTWFVQPVTKKKKWRTRYIRHEASTSSGESDKKGRELMGEGTPQGERAGGRGWSLPVAHSVY